MSAFAALAIAMGSAGATAAEVTYDFSGSAPKWPASALTLPAEWDNVQHLDFTGSLTIDDSAEEQAILGFYELAVLDFTLNVNGLEMAYHSPRDGVFRGGTHVYIDNSFIEVTATSTPPWLGTLGSGKQNGWMWLEYQSADPDAFDPSRIDMNLADIGPWHFHFGLFEPSVELWSAESDVTRGASVASPWSTAPA